eukprot:5868128-Prymnesium_polylepis.1
MRSLYTAHCAREGGSGRVRTRQCTARSIDMSVWLRGAERPRGGSCSGRRRRWEAVVGVAAGREAPCKWRIVCKRPCAAV